ncbi:MAG: putative DNA binding domain-containing protein [Deltaproteobacteria bacterium]|nr:putative DNA binding domain-containing protein [Deltaproteobacteria bacterium]
MTPQELSALVALGESATLELKSVRATGGLLDAQVAARAICALANSGGGTLVVGVEDDGSVTGVGTAQDVNRLIEQMVNVCAQGIRPPLMCRTEAVPIGGVLAVALTVPGFLPDRPFRAGTKAYVRDGAVTREAREDELRRLYSSSTNVHFDEQVVDDAVRSDLSDALIADFLREAYPAAPPDHAEHYLRALHALSSDGRPTVTGVLLFSDDPRRFLVDAHVTAIRFRGASISGDFVDRADIGGPLGAQLETTLRFLAAHVASPSRVVGTERREQGIPMEALREAVVNALAHRDYRVASQTRVFVFDDRVEIRNPGTLLNQLTLDGIRLGGISQRRNPHIAAALARLRRREHAGVGVPEMIRFAVQRGLPEPVIEIVSGDFKVVFRNAADG